MNGVNEEMIDVEPICSLPEYYAQVYERFMGR